MLTLHTLFRDPKDASEAAYQCRIIGRAEVLFTTGGYTWYIADNDAYLFGVCGPKGQHHAVNMRLNTCRCDGFKKDGDCKHRIAVAHDRECYDASLVKHYELNIAPYEALYL
jgi:hypothetical protein